MSYIATGLKDFQHLPFDIHSLILSFLHPSDILTIRKTCKTMFEATLLRSLWMKAAARMCEESTVYLSSFPVADMDIRKMEYASMGATQWRKFLSNTGNSGEAVTGKRTPLGFTVLSSELYLVPGGRFLVILDEGVLSIFDLLRNHEDAGPTDREREPIASVALSQILFLYSFTTHRTPDGSGIRIVIMAHYHTLIGASHIDYRVFEIFPDQPDPQLVSIARLSVLSEHCLDFTSVAGNRLVLVYGPLVKIWDFVTNAWASWNAGQASHQILMNEKTIALIREREVCVWDFPQLSARGNIQEEFTKLPDSGSLNYIPPCAVVPFPDEYNPEHSIGCARLCNWYTGSPQPLLFDILKKIPGTGYFDFTRFHFDSQGSRSHLELTSEAPAHLTLGDPDSQPSLEAYRVCGANTLVVTWSDLENIYCHTGGLSSDSPINAVTTLLNVKELGDRQFSLCPIAGRLCYIDPDTFTVQVVDFFPPPPAVPLGVS